MEEDQQKDQPERSEENSLVARVAHLERTTSELKLINAHLFVMITAAEAQADAYRTMGARYAPNLGEEKIKELQKQNYDKLLDANRKYHESFKEIKELIWGKKE